MPKEYALTPWPRRIHAKQDQPGPIHASIYDADMGEPLKFVLRIEVGRGESSVTVTQSKYTPPMPAIEVAEEDRPFFALDGIVVESRTYPLTRLSLDAGV